MRRIAGGVCPAEVLGVRGSFLQEDSVKEGLMKIVCDKIIKQMSEQK